MSAVNPVGIASSVPVSVPLFPTKPVAANSEQLSSSVSGCLEWREREGERERGREREVEREGGRERERERLPSTITILTLSPALTDSNDVGS